MAKGGYKELMEFLKENMATKEEIRSEFTDVRAKMADMQFSLQASINAVDEKIDVIGVKVSSLFRDMNALAGDIVDIKLQGNSLVKKKVQQP